MNWLGLKVNDPKKFKTLDTKWRVAHKDYLRRYNTAWRRSSRFVKREHEKIWLALLEQTKDRITQSLVGKLHDKAWELFDKKYFGQPIKARKR